MTERFQSKRHDNRKQLLMGIFMDEYDDYIENYLIHDFKNMKADLIPRDYETEDKICLASKIEYFLQTSQDNFLKCFGGMTIKASDKNTYTIHFTKEGHFWKMTYVDHEGRELYIRDIGTASILEELGICAKDVPPLVTPIINLYRCFKATSLDDAIFQLAQLLDINKDTPIDHVKLSPMFEWDSKAFLEYFINICEYRVCGISYGLILIKYLGEKKVLIPTCRFPTNHYCFFPFSSENNTFPLFNAFNRMNSMPIVILTDSIELAGINQLLLDRARVSEITWISWLGEGKTISNFDWSLLKDHRVYYLLKEHSGQGGKLVYNTSKAVKNKLDQIGVKEFKYVSYLDDGIDLEVPSRRSKPIPVIYTVDEFEKVMSTKDPSLPLSLKEFRNDLSRLAPSRPLLMSPFIYSRSATSIVRDSDSTTWFTLNMAFALSRGLRAFEGWCSGGKPATVLYLYGEDGGYFSLGEKLMTILKVFTDRDKIPFEQFANPILPFSGSHPQPFPMRKDGTNCFSNFSWNNIDKRLGLQDFQIAEFVNFQAASMGNQMQQERKLLVLDNLFSNSIESLAIQNNLIREFKRSGWAIVVVADAEKETNKLSVDSVIKVKNRTTDEGILKISVNVESLFKGETKFICKLDFNAGHPTFIKIKNHEPKWPDPLKRPRRQLIADVLQLRYNGLKGQAIADKLGLSLSMVKKLTTEGTGSKPKNKQWL